MSVNLKRRRNVKEPAWTGAGLATYIAVPLPAKEVRSMIPLEVWHTQGGWPSILVQFSITAMQGKTTPRRQTRHILRSIEDC